MPIEFDLSHFNRYESLSGLLKPEELTKIHNAKVALLGLGAGSNLLPLLVREGVGTSGLIVLADPEEIEVTNLVRTPYNQSQVGHNKTEAALEIIKNINPDLNPDNIYLYNEGVTPENIESICKQVDVIQEMVDIANPSIVLLIHDVAKRQGIPVLTGMDLASGTLSYVFNYNQESPYGIRDLLGFPDELKPESLTDFNSTAITAQMIIGPIEKGFDTIQNARRFYSDSFFNENNLKKLFASVPEAMVPVIEKILSGDLHRIPQSGIAGSQLGAVHMEIVNRIILGYPIKTAPNCIRLDLSNLVKHS